MRRKSLVVEFERIESKAENESDGLSGPRCNRGFQGHKPDHDNDGIIV